MASDGLAKMAKTGKCRICHRRRDTSKYVKPVGEVHHGFAVGYIWECIDSDECERVARKRADDISRLDRDIIKDNLKRGRWSEYRILS